MSISSYLLVHPHTDQITATVWREETTSRTDVQKAQYATFWRQKSKTKMYVLQTCNTKEGQTGHDLQTTFLVLKIKMLPAPRSVWKWEHDKKEMDKEQHLLCQSTIIIDQGRQAQTHPTLQNPQQNKNSKPNSIQSELMRSEGEQGKRAGVSEQ